MTSELSQHRPHTNGRVVAIIASGGTFLCSCNDEEKAPRHFPNFLEFIKENALESEFKQRGLYQNDKEEFFLEDGTQIVYYPIDPSIDSTNATSENARLKILETIETAKETHGIHTDVVLIHGTDTGANVARSLDLIYGRHMENGIGLVTSQLPANTPNSDGPDNFWTIFDAIAYFNQVIVVSNKGSEIYSGNVRKHGDNTFKIFEGDLVAMRDMAQIRPCERPLTNDNPKGTGTSLIELPEQEDYDLLAIKHYAPTAAGNQTRQARITAMETVWSLAQKEGHTALLVTLAGSNNIPDYTDAVLKATDNQIPIFATSDVRGAKTVNEENGTAKYAAAGAVLAKKLGLNNYIELPSTSIGPDMRPEIYMAYAAKYAVPRTPEYLLLCHFFAAFAWTPEDNHYNQSITGNRQDLVRAINQLEITKRNILHKTPEIEKITLSQEILTNTRVKDMLLQFVPDFVDATGAYQTTENNKLLFKPEPRPSAPDQASTMSRIGRRRILTLQR